jgi:hypothetical protein
MPYRLALLVLALLAAAPLAFAADRPSASAREVAGDVDGGLDLVRVALALGGDGRLRGELTMSAAWDAAVLRGSGSGPPAAACLRIYTKRDPSSDLADYLVCATPAREGERYVARVLRERRNAPPKTVADATASRPTARTLYLRFARTAVTNPDGLRFAGEVTVPGPNCSSSLGCRDAVPNAPKTVRLLLRPASQGR